MRALVVDDEPAVRAAVARALALEGFEVVESEDGEAPEALGARASGCTVLALS